MKLRRKEKEKCKWEKNMQKKEIYVNERDVQKKGRRRREYFGPDVEEAIACYVKSKSKSKRDRIFIEQIKEPFEELIQNIILTYEFQNLESDWTLLQQEILSHLYYNIDKFNPEKGRAFSYFGTVTKNYLIQRSIRQSFERTTSVPLDNPHRSWNSETEIQSIFVDDSFLRNQEIDEFIGILIDELGKEYDRIEKRNELKKTLESIIYFLENRDKQDIYNKKNLYVLLKGRTQLSTRQLTKCLKSIRKIYEEVAKNYYG